MSGRDVYETDAGRLIRGDCLDAADRIDSGSADLVLTDPPYGTVKGADLDGWDKSSSEWDNSIPPSDILALCRRLLRRKGKCILFAQEPYTSLLVTKSGADLPFSYRMIWKKQVHANALFANNAPLKVHEDMVVFTKEHDTNQTHPLREYFSDVLTFIDAPKGNILAKVGQRADHVFRVDSPQFSLCTRKTYQALKEVYDIQRMDDFRPFDQLQKIDKQYKQSVPNVFNLAAGEKYKTDVFEYQKPHTGDHPTQKPVPLLSDLIRTFTHEGDLVVDLTAGSGSTAVAATRTGRRFVAIEKDRDYFETAVDRVRNADANVSEGQQSLTSFSG